MFRKIALIEAMTQMPSTINLNLHLDFGSMKQATITLFAIGTLCTAIELGVLETDPNLVNICQIAVNDARAANHCSSEPIRLVICFLIIQPAIQLAKLAVQKKSNLWNSLDLELVMKHIRTLFLNENA